MPSDIQITASGAGQRNPRGISAPARKKRVSRERLRALALVGAVLSFLIAATGAAQTTTYIFTPIDVPAVRGLYLSGINNADEIVGYYQDDTFAYHGLFYSGGSFTTIDVPGGVTLALGINNAGQIVGIGGVG